MKIAITAQGKTLESQVDPRFGRATGFILVDDQSGDFQTIDNQQNINAAQGAGIQAGRTIAESKAEVLITGHCGPNAFRTLNAAGIKVVIGAEGTVAEVLEKYKNGQLKVSEQADVDGHW